MPKPAGGILNDESVHLFQKALYVEPLNYPLDLDKFPSNGHEYIHRVRLEELEIFPQTEREFSQSIPMFQTKEIEINTRKDNVDEDKKMSLSEWKRKEANFFSCLALELKSKRDELSKKFPRKQFPPIQNEKDFCLFCLGSELYKKIFINENVNDANGHFPLLSIVLHLSQEEILTVLEYISEWVSQIEMNHMICRWIYALLACLRKPVSDECEEFLEDFYDACLKKSKDCEEIEKKQLHLVTAILKNYFCVKAYTVGPSLDKFLPLC